MRREQFDLDVDHVDWVESGDEPHQPRVDIDFHGPEDRLRERLTGSDGDLLDAGATDVALRLQDDIDDPEARGVVGVTNRVTGEFILELNEEAEDVLRFIRAAREYGRHGGGDGQYRVDISIDGTALVTYEKSTFLVYDSEGSLLREESLIPSGVEL
jgi:hypothetical protein